MERELSRADVVTLLRLARQSAGSNNRDEDRAGAISRWLALPNSTFDLLSGPIWSGLVRAGAEASLRQANRILLKQRAQAALYRDIVFRKKLKELGKLFEAEGIELWTLKGTSYAGVFYDRSFPRVCQDIDLLVRPTEYERARNFMSGIARPLNDPRVPTANQGKLFESGYILEGPQRIIVEIHKNLTHELLFDIEVEQLALASLPHPELPDTGLRVLGPEHSLLHLAIHGFRDLRTLSHGLVDTFELLHRWEVDWGALCRMAYRAGADVVLHYWLSQAWLILDAPVPMGVLSRLEPPAWRSLGLGWTYNRNAGRFSQSTGRLLQALSYIFGLRGVDRIGKFYLYRRDLMKQ